MLLFALLACTVTPQEGLYMVEVTDLTSNDACAEWGVDVESLAEINATDVTFSDDGQTMELDGYVGCDVFGVDFECLLEEVEPVPRADADVVTTHVVEGTWIASYSFEATWAITVACEGSDCAGLDPCEIDFRWDGFLY